MQNLHREERVSARCRNLGLDVKYWIFRGDRIQPPICQKKCYQFYPQVCLNVKMYEKTEDQALKRHNCRHEGSGVAKRQRAGVRRDIHFIPGANYLSPAL